MPKSGSQRKKTGDAAAKAGRDVAAAEATRGARFWIGLLLILVAVGASAMLVVSHFTGEWLPGCGPGSGCAKLAASRWGSIPGIGWPVSSIGLAYFASVAVAWIGAARGVPRALVWVVRLGALVSLGFMLIMGLGRELCMYCLAAHLANFGFWWLLETSPRLERGSSPALVTLGSIFAAVTALLVATELILAGVIEERDEAQLQQSTEAIIEGSHQESGVAFTGRYRLGPANAPIRIVAFTDYQCIDCNRIELEFRQLLEQRDDLSLSIKHFPMCPDCNPFLEQNMHPNACWAARAAETAGKLRGNDGFWEMHFWLFDRDGQFTQESLRAGLVEMGYEDPMEFMRVMSTDESLDALIREDIEEGRALGLHFTPMIFVNGVELRGWTATNAVVRAVTQLAATGPPAGSADEDQPPPARQKYIDDWREYPVRRLPPDSHCWPQGDPDAAVMIEVFGDYRQPQTAELLTELRAATSGRDDVWFNYRHYPFDQSCNTTVTSNLFPGSCRAARAAQAAGELGGAPAFWAMHEWLLANQGELTDDDYRRAATAAGVDPAALMQMIDSPEIRAAVEEDIQAFKRLGFRRLPRLLINGKLVLRWKLEDEDILGQIMDIARQYSGR